MDPKEPRPRPPAVVNWGQTFPGPAYQADPSGGYTRYQCEAGYVPGAHGIRDDQLPPADRAAGHHDALGAQGRPFRTRTPSARQLAGLLSFPVTSTERGVLMDLS